MTTERAAQLLMELYPRIFFACHRRHVRDARTGGVLSTHQASILDHLDDVEPIALTALARHMGVTASTMSLAIDRLEAGGYVKRSRDRADGRRVNLRLTSSGVRIKENQSVLDAQLVTAVLSRLTAAERAAAIEGLAILAAGAAEQLRHRVGP